MKYKYSLDELETMPTKHQGHTDDLKIEYGNKRVWLSRMTIADGMPYDNQVTVEYYKNGVWGTTQEYEAV